MRAYDSLGNSIASTSVQATSALQPLTITHPGIGAVEVDVTSSDFWVLDDLKFDADQLTHARPASWGRLKLTYR